MPLPRERVRWTPEMNAAILPAIATVWTQMVSPRGRRNEVLERTLEQLKTQFPELLQDATRTAFAAHIHWLNRKCREQKNAIVVCPAYGPFNKVTPPSGKPPSAAARRGDFEALMQLYIEEQARARQELQAFIQLQLEQTLQMQETLATVATTVADIGTAIRENVKVKVKQPSLPPPPPPPRPLIVREPREPKPGDPVTDVLRSDVCYGASWEEIQLEKLTPDEVNWEDLSPYLRQKWFSRGTNRVKMVSMIVFGWKATLQALQRIFHHLGPDRVVWIHTHELHNKLTGAVNKIHPENGQFGTICPYLGKVDAHILDKAHNAFEVNHIPVWRAHGRSHSTRIDTNGVATYMLIGGFKYEWYEFSKHSARRNGCTV